MRPGRHQLAPEQQHAEEGRLEEEGGQPLVGEAAATTTLAVASEKRLQLVPNWNGMTMPETTPMPKEIAKILIQKIETRT